MSGRRGDGAGEPGSTSTPPRSSPHEAEDDEAMVVTFLDAAVVFASPRNEKKNQKKKPVYLYLSFVVVSGSLVSSTVPPSRARYAVDATWITRAHVSLSKAAGSESVGGDAITRVTEVDS